MWGPEAGVGSHGQGEQVGAGAAAQWALGGLGLGTSQVMREKNWKAIQGCEQRKDLVLGGELWLLWEGSGSESRWEGDGGGLGRGEPQGWFSGLLGSLRAGSVQVGGCSTHLMHQRAVGTLVLRIIWL